MPFFSKSFLNLLLNIEKIILDAKSKSNHYISPNIAGYIPLIKGDLVVGLGAYVPAGLGTEWNGDELYLAETAALQFARPEGDDRISLEEYLSDVNLLMRAFCEVYQSL